MSSADVTASVQRRPIIGRRFPFGDASLQLVAGAAAAGAVVLVGLIVWKVVDGSHIALSKYGLGFVPRVSWNPVVGHELYGAGSFIFGTAITSFGALLLATPLAIGVALFLTELAPRVIQGPMTALVETLAAVPSVVMGLWGILVLGPFLRDHVEPFLHDTFGFIPLFGSPGAGSSIFTAIVVLSIMVLPIVASISRELFLGVPPELKEGALALGTTRWEMVRGVVFPYARGGIAAALILGLGRAMGEAIAVTQVIGGGVFIHWSLFGGGDTLASKIAASYQGSFTDLQTASLVYLGLILLVLSLIANVTAQWIVRRVARKHGVTRGGRA